MLDESKCKLLDDYLIGSLSADLHEKFENHIQNCDRCAQAVSDWQVINATLKQSFESIVLTNKDELFDAKRSERKPTEVENSATRLFALAASLLLAIAVAITWYASEQTVDSGPKVAGQPTENTSANQSVMYADMVFDEETMAVRKCDDPEITVYQVFPKITLRTVE